MNRKCRLSAYIPGRTDVPPGQFGRLARTALPQQTLSAYSIGGIPCAKSQGPVAASAPILIQAPAPMPSAPASLPFAAARPTVLTFVRPPFSPAPQNLKQNLKQT